MIQRKFISGVVLAAACTTTIAQAPAPGAAGKATAQAASAKTAPAAPAKVPAWPTKPVRLLIGFPPGSVQDLSARSIAEPLSRALGQPVVVENKAGASGTIAADQVAKSTDQHTFGVMNNSQLTIAKMLNPAVAYDPERDLAPVALIGTTPMVLVVSAQATGNTPQDWLGWLRGLRTTASFGSPGTGTPGHLGMELIKSRSGIEAVHIPYQGNPQIITAMLSGQLHAALLPPGLALQQVKAGKLKAVGVTAERRSVLATDIPTLREAGVLGSDVELWTALAGPASLPPHVREKMASALIDVVKADETRNRLITVGWQPTPSTAEGLRMRMRSDVKTFGGIIMMRNIRSES
ncbi:MAG TPA: tripartite tricarboxylate transporter substrate binding protein [Ramlibacter sp.]|nr:tripartite tricarboxylate transporter substrate binding protein [Ramlibacter sp.]